MLCSWDALRDNVTHLQDLEAQVGAAAALGRRGGGMGPWGWDGGIRWTDGGAVSVLQPSMKTGVNTHQGRMHDYAFVMAS